MPVDPSIALQFKAPDPITSISSYLDFGRKKLAFDKERETFAAEVARSKAESSSAESAASLAAKTLPDKVDQQKEITEQARTTTKKNRFDLDQGKAKAGRAELTALFNSRAVQKAQQAQTPEEIESLGDEILDEIAEAQQRMIQAGIDPGTAMRMTMPFSVSANKDPRTFRDFVGNALRASTGAGTQMEIARNPGAENVANGAGAWQRQGQGADIAGQTPGAVVPGSGVALQPGPTTGTTMMTPDGPAPGIMGASTAGMPAGALPGGQPPMPQAPQAAPPAQPPAGAPIAPSGPLPVPAAAVPGGMQIPPERQRAMDGGRAQIIADELAKAQAEGRTADVAALQRELARATQAAGQPARPPAPPAGPGAQGGPIQTGPAAGQAEAWRGTTELVQRDRAGTMEAAEAATRNKPVLENIKKYADKAAAGVASDRRAMAAAVGQYFGLPEGNDVATNTDLLKKNAAMLSLLGGNTDAMRSIAEAANPNAKMTPDAIKEASNQIIAISDMALNKQKFLGPVENNPQAYSAKLREWNQDYGDFRVLQFPLMTEAQQKRLLYAMDEKQAREFRRKMKKATDAGFLE